MIPSPETPRESADFCLEVFQISTVEHTRLAHIFVEALETYLHDPWAYDRPAGPSDPDELDAYNRLMNRTFGFMKVRAIQQRESAADGVRRILGLMRAEIDERDGADRLQDALYTISDGGRDKDNAMLSLIRQLKKV